MYNGKVIDTLIRKEGITAKEFCQKIGWNNSKQLYQFKNGNPSAKMLELVADYFRIPIDTLFTRDIQADQSEPDARQLLAAKDALLAEKDKRISTLERMIEILSERDSTRTK